MKTSLLLTYLAATATLSAQPTKPQVVARDAHSRTWQWETPIERPDGKTEMIQHGYVEVGSGICRWNDKEEKWIDAAEVIEAFPGGAIGRSAQLQAVFAPNLNTFGAIDTLAPDGNRIQSHILGLAFYDLAAQKSVMIAEVKDCRGEVLPPNQVIYRDAFDGTVSADVIYTYKLGSFHQDLVLKAQLAVTPEDYQLSSDSTVLEIWTEMSSSAEPKRVPQPAVAVLRARNDPAAPALALIDEEVNFGGSVLTAGRAFSTDSRAAADPFASDALPVAKNWVSAEGGRKCLVEQVAYVPLRDHLNRALPQAKAIAPEQRAAIHRGRAFPSAPQQAQANRPAQPMQMAALKPGPGFTIDYEQVIPTTNMTFKGDTTYLVMSTVNLSGTTTIEGGTVIKHTNGTSSAYLNVGSGNVECKTTPWLPAILTSFNDNSVGEVIPGSSGTPTMTNGATRLRIVSTNSMHDLRFRYAEYGLVCNASSAKQSLTNVQFYQCRYPLYGSGGRYDVHNMLLTDCQTVLHNFNSATELNIEHGTFDRVTNLISSVTNSLLHLTNCLLTSVSGNLYYVGESNVVLSSGSGVFQTVGGGEHYLAENSPYRDAGTTNISAEMRTALKSLTTYPPVLLNNPISTDTVLSPQAGRDSDLPDLGFHYTPLDFFISAVTVASNATVLATNGVAIGIDYFVTNSWGFLLAPGIFLSQGSPVSMNHLVRAHNVQEKATGNPGTRACFYDGNTPGGSASTLRARFTEFAQMANDGYLLYTGTKFDAVELTHSAVYNPSLVIDTSGNGLLVVGVTNTLWERGGVVFGLSSTSAGKVVHCRNNLWRGVSLHFIAGNTNWTVADEIFDRVYYVGDHGSPVLNNTNAWYLTNYGLSGGLGIIQLTNLTYEIGPLGRYYRPDATFALTNGSRTADLAQLYHFTTTTNQVKDGTTKVDLGLHYAAVTNLAGIWQPTDSDGDGVPDYQEDQNQNGIVDSGETSFADPDTDFDGRSDGAEILTDLTDPLNPTDVRDVRLTSWHFDDSGWLGDRGQAPLSSLSLQQTSSWSGQSLLMDNSAPELLKYRAVEADGTANLTCQRGSIRFWLTPNWNSGAGPGATARLIEMGNTTNTADGWWALSIDAAGSQMQFQSASNGTVTTYFTQNLEWTAGHWHQIVVTYSTTATHLYIDGTSAASGTGIQSFPRFAARWSAGFSIGSDGNGEGQVRGAIDELETFNYPIDESTIASDFQAASALDTDGDGLPDLQENELGTNPLASDSDGDGLPDAAEVNTYQTDPLLPDTDYDGRSDGQEVADQTSPTSVSWYKTNRLARWDFNTTGFVGERGQKPLQATNLSLVSSWSGMACQVDSPNAAILNYRELEPDGTANINCRNGSIILWFKPNWTSVSAGGSGPGDWARLIEMGNRENPSDGWWALSIDSLGNQIYFETEKDGVHTEYMTWEFSWASNQWHQIAITYDETATRFYLDGNFDFADSGIPNYPIASARAASGISIGSNRSGGEQARGQFDNIETFNYCLAAGAIYTNYVNRINLSASSCVARLPGRINTNSVFVQVDGSPTASMAVLVNNTNLATATWVPLSSFTLTNLSGTNLIYLGFLNQGVTNWLIQRVIVDTTPPWVSLTSPLFTNSGPSAVVARPIVQLQGFSEEALSAISFCLTNALATNTDQQAFIIRRHFDTNSGEFTTNWFQCFDLELAPGTNRIFLRAVDLAGNVTITNLVCLLDLSGMTNAPVVTGLWPGDGASVGADTTTLRGFTDDPTAHVTATVTANGETVAVEGLVERDGLFWLENLPLNATANTVTLTLSNAAGLVTSSNLSLTRSPVSLSINPVESSMLPNRFVTVTGTLSDNSYSVWVNGVKAGTPVASGSGYTWTAENVPVNQGGTASFQAVAIPDTDNGGNGTPPSGNTPPNNVNAGNPASSYGVGFAIDVDRPAEIRIKRYDGAASDVLDVDPCEWWAAHFITSSTAWQVDTNGNRAGGETHVFTDVYCEDSGSCSSEVAWGNDDTASSRFRCGTEEWSAWEEGWEGPYPAPTYYWEHCAVRVQGDPGWPDVYTRYGQTTIELRTGGKALARRSNLFTISPVLHEVLVKRLGLRESTADHRYINPGDTPVTILGQRVADDGLLHLVLPDNAVLDATPTTAGVDFYRFSVGAAKHDLGLVWPSGISTNPPADPNRRCFSSDRPGWLQLNLVAIVSNSAVAWPLTNLVRFEVDDIPGSTKMWGPLNPGGRPVANGAELTATVFFTNMPPSNSGFGRKFARLKFAGELRDEKCFWAFYPAYAYNYPGCVDPELPRVPPNYFQYYMQTAAAVDSPDCNSPRYAPASYTTFGIGRSPPFPYYVAAELGASPKRIPTPGVNADEMLSYIDLFAWAGRHERSHHDAYHAWWTSGTPPREYSDSTDWDRDFLPDELEFQMTWVVGGPFNNGMTDTYGTDELEDDDQRYTCMTAEPWDVGCADEEDWAYPGNQWP